MRLAIFVCLVALALGQEEKKVRYDGHQVLSIKTKDEAELNQLYAYESYDDLDIAFWTEPDLERPQDIQVGPGSVDRFKSMLDQSGIEYEVAIEDLQKNIDIEAMENEMLRQQAIDEAGDGVPSVLGRYASNAEILAWVDNLARQYPTLCKTESIGKSYEGRDMRLLTVSSGGSKPSVFIDALIHAREWIAGGVVTHVINQLVTSSAGKSLLQSYDFYFVAVANPDGYEYTRYQRMWRKTRSPNAGSTCRGSDANRNFDFYWGQAGVSRNPCADTYPGRAAFSEIETRNLRDAINARSSRMLAYITLHSYSQLWLTPWGAIPQRPVDGAEIDRVGRIAASAIYNTHGRSYRVGSPPQILYAASGGSFDWVKGKAGVKYGFAPELRPASAREGGFILPPSHIVPNGQEIWNGIVDSVKALRP